MNLTSGLGEHAALVTDPMPTSSVLFEEMGYYFQKFNSSAKSETDSSKPSLGSQKNFQTTQSDVLGGITKVSLQPSD